MTFLVALPLSLGVASFMGAPLLSGILSSVVAGVVVTWLSGTRVTVSGPTAGLAMVILWGIQSLGSFEAVLTALVLAGFLQLLFSAVKLGSIASFVPHSVVRGMLTAVGLIMILKQIPHALGWDANFLGDESFASEALMSTENTFTEIYHAIIDLNPLALVIATVTIIVFLACKKHCASKPILATYAPPAVLAIVAGTLVHEVFALVAPELDSQFSVGHFIQMPPFDINHITAALQRHDWSLLGRSTTWVVALAIACYSSLETLLTVEASDRYDPKQIPANGSRELLAHGVGNLICGLIGGLPIAAGVLRTTANIYGGASSRLSNLLHGLLFLIFALLGSALINRIPIAAFSALIIVVGYQLVRVQFWKIEYQEGPEQFLPFVVTIIASGFTDVLSGVAVGLLVGLAIVIRMNHHSAITVVSDGSDILVRFAKDVTFAHKASLKKILRYIPPMSNVTIDGTGAHFIDYDIVDTVRDFRDGAPARSINVTLKNLRSKRMSIRGVLDGKLQEPFAGK
jgi:MFS superfamily sulfate permease-like transporter